MSNDQWVVAEQVTGQNLWLFASGSNLNSNPYMPYYSTEAEAIRVASDRAQRENRAFLVLHLVATIRAEPILPQVKVVRQ